MWLRKTPPGVIQRASDRLDEVGFEHSLIDLEAHHLAGGNVLEVVECVAALWERGCDPCWETICGLDLAGRDLGEVQRVWDECNGNVGEILRRIQRR